MPDSSLTKASSSKEDSAMTGCDDTIPDSSKEAPPGSSIYHGMAAVLERMKLTEPKGSQMRTCSTRTVPQISYSQKGLASDDMQTESGYGSMKGIKTASPDGKGKRGAEKYAHSDGQRVKRRMTNGM